MPMPGAPEDHRARIREQACLVLRQRSSGDPQILEASPGRQRHRGFVGELRCEDDPTVELSEQHVLCPGNRGRERVAHFEQSGAETPGRLSQQAARLPDRNEKRRGIAERRFEKTGVLAQVRGAIEIRT